jgi:exodeoxyribonuclease-3
VAVVQECEEELSGLPDGASYQWFGHNPRRGLGVISFRGDIEIDQSFNSSWTYFLPINAGGFKILAVWAFNHRTGKYGDDSDGYPLSVLPQLDPWLTGSNTLILGDFNNSVIWDKPKGTNNFTDIAGRLGEKGFKSAYHEFTGEAYGQESGSTFYHTRKQDKPYHIDYCFYPSSVDLVNVQIGAYEDWIKHSDHVPVIVDIGAF